MTNRKTIGILKLPAEIASLSESEINSLQDVVGIAEDLSMRGDDRATVAMEWARDLLARVVKKIGE